MAAGSYGVSHGETAAITASSVTITAPLTNRRRLRRIEPSPTPRPLTAGSATLDPGVDHAVEEIDGEVGRQHEHRREEDRARHERNVEAEDRLHGEPSESRQVEDR